MRDWNELGLKVRQLAYGSGREDAREPDERLGYGHSEGEEKGLANLGRSAIIAEMNAIGMVVDVSHSSKQAVLDAAATSTKPIIATHVNAEALTPVSRNSETRCAGRCAHNRAGLERRGDGAGPASADHRRR